jgi:hypothetical protein
MRCVISQAWNACLPYRGFDAMRLTGRLKITDAERDERIKKTVEALTFARTRSDDNHQHT